MPSSRTSSLVLALLTLLPLGAWLKIYLNPDLTSIVQRENALEDQYSRAPDQDRASIRQNLNSAREDYSTAITRRFQDLGLALFLVIVLLAYTSYLAIASQVDQQLNGRTHRRP